MLSAGPIKRSYCELGPVSNVNLKNLLVKLFFSLYLNASIFVSGQNGQDFFGVNCMLHATSCTLLSQYPDQSQQFVVYVLHGSVPGCTERKRNSSFIDEHGLLFLKTGFLDMLFVNMPGALCMFMPEEDRLLEITNDNGLRSPYNRKENGFSNVLFTCTKGWGQLTLTLVNSRCYAVLSSHFVIGSLLIENLFCLDRCLQAVRSKEEFILITANLILFLLRQMWTELYLTEVYFSAFKQSAPLDWNAVVWLLGVVRKQRVSLLGIEVLLEKPIFTLLCDFGGGDLETVIIGLCSSF